MPCNYGEEECDHINHVGMRHCPGLTKAQKATAEKIRSVGLQFSYGREQFHGSTLREQEREIFANAKKYGHKTPDYQGPRSKGRAYSEMKAEIV